MNLRVAVAIGLAMAGVCRGQHSDVLLQVSEGRLEVGRLDPARPGSPVDTSWRVFEAEFEGDSNVTDEPGFNATSGSGLPGNTLLGFNILDGVRKWDAGAGAFGPVIPGALTVQLGGVVFAPSPAGCNQVQAGFAFAQTGATGSVHQHMQFELEAPAAPGVYLLKLEVYAEHPAIAASEPFWIVFAKDDEANHEAAAEYVRGVIAGGGCAGDVNGDGAVSGADLSVLLGEYGACVMNGTSADFNGDGVVTGADLSVLLANYGAGC